MKFRKKPIVIDAIQFDGTPAGANAVFDEFVELDVVGGRFVPNFSDLREGKILIPTLEGDHNATAGDWIIKGINGEFYPVKDDIFIKTYEPV